ncbi:MAG: acetoin utilization protein AcuC [Rhizobiales bacterium]|nr:acetoin utilization protein AcuC [Hyphomicrobiales bacterium]
MAPCFISSHVYRATGYGAAHPLGIPRIGTVMDICEAMGWLTVEAIVDSPRASVDDLLKFHDADYIEALQLAETAGRVSPEVRAKYNLGGMENPVFQGVFERASMSVGGSIHAAELSLAGRIAYHPAGGTHHGRRDRASGFCYFNDPVFAILTYLEHDLERVLYVDIDAHHGDGVEDAFADDPRVFTISVHEENRWPNSGLLRDRREGRARNLPVPKGFNDTEFAYLMDDAVMPVAEQFGPQAVVITCGADALRGDPLSRLELSNGALWDAVMQLVGLSVPTVVLGGGGYNPWTVARCWAGLWARISGQSIPGELPQTVRKILSRLESDLVDEDDVEAQWLDRIADQPNRGVVRQQVRDVASATLKAL